MAITKLLSPNTPNPITAGPNGDWDLAMAQLTAVKKLLAGEQMMLTEWTNATTQPKLALGTHLQHKGSIYVVDTEDYALPALGGNGTYYIVLEPSGSSLVGSWVTSLGGYTWDATYNGLYNGDKLALPYQVVKSASGVAKRKILNPWALNGFTTVDYLGNVQGVNNLVASGDISATGKLTGATVSASGDISATGKLTGATVSAGNELLLQGKKVHIVISSMTKSSFASPGPNPYGLTFDGVDLISCDNNTARIYVHDGISSTIKTSFASPGANPYGLTFNGVDLISCDNNNARIYVHDGISSTIKTSFESPGPNPFGLTFDGVDLISCDYNTDKIYVHNGISSTIKTSFASPGATPNGLAFDGTNLISCDNNNARIYVHDGISSTIKTSFASPGTSPSGLTFDGTDLISCDYDTDRIYVNASILALL